MNDKNKVFELAPVKTPEEIQNEVAREIAPKIRGAVWFARLHPAAKGFFAFLLDMTFLYKAGGNGQGKLFTTTRKLARDYRCDKDSVTKWRRLLVSKNLLWYREAWPRSEYRILALCPAPLEDLPWDEEVFNAGRSDSKEAVRQQGTSLFLAENGESPHESEETGQLHPEKPDTLSPVTGQTVPQNRTRGGITPDTSVPQNRTRGPIEPDNVSREAGRTWRAVGDKVSGNLGTKKETPMELRSKGASGSVPGAHAHDGMPRFEELDLKMVPRMRREWGKETIGRYENKIAALQEGGGVPESRRARINAYKAQIRNIKDFMAGILPEAKT